MFNLLTSEVVIEQWIITENLAKFSKFMTIVVIAHRLSSIKNADMIFYLKDNKILGQGNFFEGLIASRSFLKHNRLSCEVEVSIICSMRNAHEYRFTKVTVLIPSLSRKALHFI